MALRQPQREPQFAPDSTREGVLGRGQGSWVTVLRLEFASSGSLRSLFGKLANFDRRFCAAFSNHKIHRQKLFDNAHVGPRVQI